MTIQSPEGIAFLARDALRNIVLLKYLERYPEHARVHFVSDAQGGAALVLLDTRVDPYNRRAYPMAAWTAVISSDHPDLTRSLLERLPRRVGIVFKLATDEDRAVVEAEFPLTRATCFLSFSGSLPSTPDEDVLVTSAPSAAVFRLFETQNHERQWLEPLLDSGRALVSIVPREGRPLAICFAFENYGSVWEVGGVITLPEFRGKGLAARSVRVAIGELARRGLAPRYQVEEGNVASIRLATKIGLKPFLSLTHYLHAPAPVAEPCLRSNKTDT